MSERDERVLHALKRRTLFGRFRDRRQKLRINEAFRFKILQTWKDCSIFWGPFRAFLATEILASLPFSDASQCVMRKGGGEEDGVGQGRRPE